MSRDWRNEHLCLFLRVIALCCCYHHCTLENECMWWWQAAAAKSNHPRKRACMLVSEGRGWQVMVAAAKSNHQPPSKTSAYARFRGYSGGGSSKEQSPSKTSIHARFRGWLVVVRVLRMSVGGDQMSPHYLWVVKSLLVHKFIGISKRTYLVGG